MEYERIHKPLPSQGGGFSISPKKLRSMLLGLEKRHIENEEGEQLKTTDQEAAQADNRRARVVDCQDMECSTSVSLPNSTDSGPQQQIKTSIARDDDNFDSDSFSFGFQFQKPGTTNANSVAVPVQRFNMVPSFLPPFSKPTPSKWDDAEKWISSPNANKKGNGKVNRKLGLVMNKVVVVDPKKADLSKVKKVGVITGGGFGLGKAKGKGPSWVGEPFELIDLGVKHGVIGDDKPVVDSAASVNRDNVPATKKFDGAPLASEVRSVLMRDMGTEMTPIASEEPSCTTTPVRGNTPARSSTSSRTPTPSRHPATPEGVVSEVEPEAKTMRDIMELSEQLGKTKIAAWASRAAKEDEKRTPDQSSKINLETRAADWEAAQKSKYLDRFKRDEVRIQAWEDQQKAKIEAEMQKMEANLQKIRAHAQEKWKKRMAATKHKANAKRVAAEAKRQKEATRTAKQADFIRQTGHAPTRYFSGWSFCF